MNDSELQRILLRAFGGCLETMRKAQTTSAAAMVQNKDNNDAIMLVVRLGTRAEIESMMRELKAQDNNNRISVVEH